MLRFLAIVAADFRHERIGWAVRCWGLEAEATGAGVGDGTEGTDEETERETALGTTRSLAKGLGACDLEKRVK